MILTCSKPKRSLFSFSSFSAFMYIFSNLSSLLLYVQGISCNFIFIVDQKSKFNFSNYDSLSGVKRSNLVYGKATSLPIAFPLIDKLYWDNWVAMWKKDKGRSILHPSHQDKFPIEECYNNKTMKSKMYYQSVRKCFYKSAEILLKYITSEML